MPAFRGTGITIARRDYSETSQVVTLYTRERGKVAMLAKGSKRPANKLGGPLDLLDLCEIVFLPRGPALAILIECEVVDQFLGIRGSLRSMFAGLYAAEVLGRMTAEGDPNPGLFDDFLATLRALAEGMPPDLARVSFEIKLLDRSGYLPELKRCVSCVRDASGLGRIFFSAAAGGIVCGDCRKGLEGAIPMNPQFRGEMLRLLSTPLEELAESRPRKEAIAGISRVLRLQIVYVLESAPRLMRYVSA